MTDTELKKIAKVIYAEGGIFSGKNDLALLAIAQCIHDLLSSYKAVSYTHLTLPTILRV